MQAPLNPKLCSFIVPHSFRQAPCALLALRCIARRGPQSKLLRSGAFTDNAGASNLKVTRSISVATRLCREASHPLVLVPTMGALHRGHTSLIARARSLAGPRGTVAVSLFVNPTQFGPKEDLQRYPRPFAKDRQLCEEHGADLLFHPSPTAMYPEGYSTYIEEQSLSSALCGASRPGHFRGVCTVVAKLFHILQPDSAVFGLKDFQQFMVIRRMVRDLHLPVRIIPAETVREADGLALSSRNQFLTPAERAQAPILRQALNQAREAIQRGETRVPELRALLLHTLSKAPLARVDYVEFADAQTLQPLSVTTGDCVVAMAVFFGQTRLIDNLWIR